MTQKTVQDVLDQVDASMDTILSRLCDLIRIPSISTDPAHAADCARAAQWLVDDLAAMGFEASSRETPGHPVVVAHDTAATTGPHVLFYGHYDVQPPDPLDLWYSPPFEPRIVQGANGRRQIVARGASDDKGQLMTFLEACRAWKQVTGSLPIAVTILLEGEEEVGSRNLPEFLTRNAPELSHDIALVCDTDLWDDETPAVTTSVRGLVIEEIEITCADRDLHSGMYGNVVRNPFHVLTRALADLHDEDGRITLEGFYDGVAPLPPEVRQEWDRLPFDAGHFLGQFGLSISAGEQGYSLLEQIWARPSFEVHGIKGGYSEPGFKTVLPSRASAKVSFRLVGEQDPETIRAAFRAYIRARVPTDCTVTFINHGVGYPASLPIDGELLQRARTALSAEWGRPAAISGTGGSIPVISSFRTLLGMDSLMIGFARFDNRIHSPNEKYDLDSLYHGIRSWFRILGAYASQTDA